MLKDSPQYFYHNFYARQRQTKLPIELKYDEWYNWWLETSKFHLRGPRPDDYCMARIDKTKGWNLDNIHCIQNKNNRNSNMPTKKEIERELAAMTLEMLEWRELALDYLYKDIDNKKLEPKDLLANALGILAKERAQIGAALSK